MEENISENNRIIFEEGVATQSGFLLVQASAAAIEVAGNVVVDIRRGDGTGGSLSAARVTVACLVENQPEFQHITMPILSDEIFIVYAETKPNDIAPQISLRKINF